ncbi:MAG: DUF2797 domain-containing protein [Vicingaceae bacterium]
METRTYEGNLRKMPTVYEAPIKYKLPLGEETIQLNPLIGTQIKMHFTGLINCINCGRKTNKSFAQGFCYPCFRDAPQNAECIIRPELCRAHLGEGRDPEWEERNHNQPHVVYLAVSSGLKVGVTRSTQVPYRWIDQGAWKAIKLAETENRYQAGMIEIDLKQYVSDKTAWQRMLKNELADELEVLAAKEKMQKLMDDEHNQFDSKDDKIYEIEYPVIEYPTKVKSHNLDKEPTLEGKLMGIKGQYWLFEGGKVINIRKYGGYYVELEVEA